MTSRETPEVGRRCDGWAYAQCELPAAWATIECQTDGGWSLSYRCAEHAVEFMGDMATWVQPPAARYVFELSGWRSAEP
jgi:hypothetical protein